MAKELIISKDITATQLLLSKIAVAAGTGYVLLLLALHILEPEFDPAWRFISEYALGKFGFLMNMCFLLYSAAAICIILLVRPHIKTIVGYIGLVILAISALGIAMAGLFNTDPISTEMSQASTSGMIHYTGASLDFAPLAFLLLAFSLGRNKAWQSIRTRLLITSVISILLTVAFMASMPADYKFDASTYTGLIGRFLFVSYLPSILVIGFHARKLYAIQNEGLVQQVKA